MTDTDQTRAPAGSEMARWSAKVLLVAAAVALVGGALWYARAATVPLIVAALIATQILPLIEWAVSRGVKRGLAVAGSMLGVLVIGAGLGWLFADALFSQIDSVGVAISEGVDEVIAWLQGNNAWVEEHEDAIRGFLNGILPAAKDAAAGLVSTGLGGLALVAQLVSSALLALVFLLYIVTDGDSVWRWIQGRFGASRRDRVAIAGTAAWNAAGGYVRGIALIALIDSLVIGAGMLVFGTPLAGTLMLLSFVCLFIPILGAWVSGTVIVLITLGAQGSSAALGMAVVILIGQQLDSMFVTPLVYKRQVNLHPIVTLTGVIVGSQLMGIIGAFLAVPMIAVGWAVFHALERPEAAEAQAASSGLPSVGAEPEPGIA